MSQFTNKTVVVTGGTDGIGRALVLNLLALGANVVTCGRSQQKILSLEAEAPMGKICVLNADVSVEKDCERLVDDAVKVFGGIDVLINNAGNAHGMEPFQEGNWTDWEAMIDINIKGLVAVTEAVLPLMLARK